MNDYKKNSSFDADDRLPTFAKDSYEERIIQLLNESLSDIQKTLERAITYSNYPIILIIGTPRSGSTLLTQLLTSRLDVGYPSNLMARFYEAPSVGAFLQKRLIGNRFQDCREYKSLHGITTNIEEPHEFGYFWSRHLGVCGDVHEPDELQMENVRIEKLEKELNSIVKIFDKPVIFKSILGDFFIPILRQIPNVFFVDLQRNLLDVAQSFWKVRQERLGSVNKWWSLKPRNYLILKDLSPPEQIVGQILAIRRAIESNLANVENERKMVIHYEDLVKAPEAVIDTLIQKLLPIGCSLKKVGTPIAELDFPKPVAIETTTRLELEKALASL